MSRPYKYGLIVGRFQPLHKGQEALITEALMLCDAVVVYVDSKFGDKENPYSVSDRIKMLQKVFAGNVANKTLLIEATDFGTLRDNIEIGEFIFNKFKSEFNCLPNLYASGTESLRSKWFNNNLTPNISELNISKKRFDFSGTQCREFIKDNQIEKLKEALPNKLNSDANYLVSEFRKIAK